MSSERELGLNRILTKEVQENKQKSCFARASQPLARSIVTIGEGSRWLKRLTRESEAGSMLVISCGSWDFE